MSFRVSVALGRRTQATGRLVFLVRYRSARSPVNAPAEPTLIDPGEYTIRLAEDASAVCPAGVTDGVLEGVLAVAPSPA